MSHLSAYSKIVLLICGATWLTSTFTLAQPSSVLSEGNWYKLSVDKPGVYRISFDLLKRMGIPVENIDPRKIRLYGNEGGMLPQSNNVSRPVDLLENSIYVHGESDGVLHSGDYILFYAQGPDKISFDIEKDIFYYENNLYAENNFYYLTISAENGKRIGNAENIAGSYPIIDSYNAFHYHEVDEHNELKSGRVWFGEKFDLTTGRTFNLNLSNIVPDSPITLVSSVMAQSTTGSTFKILANGAPVAEQFVLPVPNAQYAIKGIEVRDTITTSSGAINASGRNNLEITYQYIKGTGGRSVGYLDFMLVNVIRQLNLYGDQTSFLSAQSLNYAVSTFSIGGTSSSTTIWDISDPYNIKLQPYTISGATATFSASTNSLKQFIAFNQNIPVPEFKGEIPNQNLRALQPVDLLIITHPMFLPEASRLAQHRQTHSQWSTAVVTMEQIYNEFSSGRQDVTALRDFIKTMYDKEFGKLQAVLLFGRGSYDYKERLQNNTNFIPTYESRNSLHPLETYSSDDYFVFLEDSEGTWWEESAEDHTLDVGIGRLPVKNAEEAKVIVDKIIHYDTNPRTLGSWRKDIVIVADDGDFNIHQSQADQLAGMIENEYPEYDLKKIYIDAYPQVLRPNGEVVPEANKRIRKSIEKGALIINYTGHGSEKIWAQERILDDLMIEEVSNKHYPLFVTATCEFGRNDDPGQISSAELGLLKENGGAIGMITTSRPVNSSTNFELNTALYNSMFQLSNNTHLALGEIVRATKNNSTSGVANRNFILLGDPSLTLAFPPLQVKVTEIVNDEGFDTLKALSHVRVKGHITNHTEETVTSFSGILNVTVFDKETGFTTLGNENTPFLFSQWHNALFRGKAQVTNGTFEFDFIVPKAIAYSIGNGKMSLYAYNETNMMDAKGAISDFVVGKSNLFSPDDASPPNIRLYIGDTTFVNGGVVSSNTKVIARLADEHGINISGYGIGNTMTIVLDDSLTFEVNEYYEADLNTYQEGTIDFPLEELAPGHHTLTLKVWDTHNNASEAAVTFFVPAGEGLIISEFGNYPNPFKDQTTLYLTHNKAGEDIETIVGVYDLAGNLLKSHRQVVYSSTLKIILLELNTEEDFTKKLPGGLYLARVNVRSLTDGAKSERVTKLIVLN